MGRWRQPGQVSRGVQRGRGVVFPGHQCWAAWPSWRESSGRQQMGWSAHQAAAWYQPGGTPLGRAPNTLRHVGAGRWVMTPCRWWTWMPTTPTSSRTCVLPGCCAAGAWGMVGSAKGCGMLLTSPAESRCGHQQTTGGEAEAPVQPRVNSPWQYLPQLAELCWPGRVGAGRSVLESPWKPLSAADMLTMAQAWRCCGGLKESACSAVAVLMASLPPAVV